MGILLVLVLIILLVIFFSGVGQSIFSSQVLSHTQRASLGNMCLYAAQSACEEIGFRVQQRVNRPADNLFGAFRGKVFGSGPSPFDIDLGTLEQTRQLLATLPTGGRFSLDDVGAQVVFRRQFRNLTYETYGTLHIHATVSSGLLSGITRTVDVYRDFKVALLSPPRPFGKAGVFIGSAEGMLPPGDPNLHLKQCYLIIRDIWRQFRDIRDKAQELCDNGEAQQEHVDKAQAALDEVVSAAGPMLVGVNPDGSEPAAQAPYDWNTCPQPRKESELGPHYFGDSSVTGKPLINDASELIIIIPATTAVDLHALDLLQTLRPLDDAKTQAQDAYEAKKDEIVTASSSADEADLDEMKDLAVACVQASRAVLQAYFEFQALVSEKTGDSRTYWLENFVAKKLTLADWQAKAFYTVKSIAEFDRLLEQVRPLNGIVYIDSDERFSMSNCQHQGKLIIVTRGETLLDNVGATDPTVDQLTFVCFGRLRVSGTIRASLILGLTGSTPPPFETSGSVTIEGNIVSAARLNFMAGQLQGTVTYLDTLDSGDTGEDEKLNHHFVAISPTIRARGVKRQ